MTKENDDNLMLEAFEWLTSPESLEPFLAAALQPASDDDDHDDDDHNNNNRNNNNNNNSNNGAVVLHLGCGSSALGEYLLLMSSQDDEPKVRHVVNVDRDAATLGRLQERWENKKKKKQQQQGQRHGSSTVGDMSFVQMDFGSHNNNQDDHDGGACLFAVTTDDPTSNDNHNSNNNIKKPLSSSSLLQQHQLFDLIVDKSTLDCCLCSDGDDAAGLLHMVLQHLHPERGVYLVVSFHHVNFLQPLLQNLPGAADDWQVQHDVLQRQCGRASSGTKDDNDGVEDAAKVGATKNKQEHPVSSSSAWSTGTFQPDEHYRKTVNVFTCRRRRRRRRQPPSLTCQSPSSCRNTSSHTADDNDQNYLQQQQRRQAIQEHLIRIHDEWYQLQNPLLTPERKEHIRTAIQSTGRRRRHCTTKSDDNDTAAAVVVVVTLPEAYELLFTDAEREHLTYQHFLQDWAAFCSNHNDDDNDTMSADTAIAFLEEMQ